MKLFLCSNISNVLDRWQQFLEAEYTLTSAVTISEIRDKIKDTEFDLIIIHRLLVDLNFLNDLKGVPFIVLTDKPDDYEAVEVLRKGSLAYANTYMSQVRLLEAVKVALSGRVWIGRDLLQKIILGTSSSATSKTVAGRTLDQLSEREREVAGLIGKGRSNLEIAADLEISERTVKAHVSTIFKKTSTTSRLQLALLMRELGT